MLEEVNVMRAKSGSGLSAPSQAAEPPDLPSQVESLFHTVWECERDWRLDNRIELALRREQARARAVQKVRRGL